MKIIVETIWENVDDEYLQAFVKNKLLQDARLPLDSVSKFLSGESVGHKKDFPEWQITASKTYRLVK